MGVFTKVDRALDRLDQFDEWVRDRLPDRWVRTVPVRDESAGKGTPSSSDRLLDVISFGRFLVPILWFSGWLIIGGAWWTAILGALVCVLGIGIVVIYAREVRRRT